MKIIHSVKEMQSEALRIRRAGCRIGFVPTMGFLHEGHLSLIRKARDASNFLVVSVFVNPTQFGPAEDFNSYPRDIERDGNLCRQENVDVMFYPPADEMYAADHSVHVEESELCTSLCGPFRPGHFRGVTTIVAKLFNIVQPDVAVFGQKDVQQARIIERMARDLNFPVEIIIAPIVREADGLAMSSRNMYLSAQERKRATCIYESLHMAERLCDEGIKDTAVIRNRMRDLILECGMKENILEAPRSRKAGQVRASPRQGGVLTPKSEVPVEIDYIETVDYRTLKPVDRIEDMTLIAVAVRIGKTRLIDNTVMGSTAVEKRRTSNCTVPNSM